MPASPGGQRCPVVVDLVTVELPLQIALVPKQSLIEVFAPDLRALKFIAEKRTQWRMTQSDANQSPPSDSLISSKNTGNFTDFGLDLGSASSETAVVADAFSKIPYKSEQGINFGQTGKFS